jgi:protein disulfide-isomerase
MRLDPQPKWIPGDPRWGVLHEGRTYLLAGPEEQQVFLDNPWFFAPVLSGNDPVFQVEQSRQMPGVREFGARWRDRVYLFSSRENYEKFQANPEFYEREVLGLQQAAAKLQQQAGQQLGGRMNLPYGYR